MSLPTYIQGSLVLSPPLVKIHMHQFTSRHYTSAVVGDLQAPPKYSESHFEKETAWCQSCIHFKEKAFGGLSCKEHMGTYMRYLR